MTDEDGRTVQVSEGNAGFYLTSRDAQIRRTAWAALADAHLGVANTLGETLQTAIKADVFSARAHGFTTSLESALAPNDVPISVFHTVIATVRKSYPTWHRYFHVRRQLLGIETLHPGDLLAPLGDSSLVISWPDGVEMILDSLTPLGDDYMAVVRQGIAHRWVDPLPNQGKSGGAFSALSYGTMPYISMTWRDDLDSVSTLTHELGHSLHSWHANQAQPFALSAYSLTSAETASTVHQALLGQYLLTTRHDCQWVLAALEERMTMRYHMLFVMVILTQFELWTHTEIEAGRALTGKVMTDKLVDLFIEGYGGEVEVAPEDRARLGITWARYPNLFMNFYVFQYAVGLSAAAALTTQILTSGQPAITRYLDFLREGGSSYPLDQLRRAGVDMNAREPIQAAFDHLAGYIDHLEELARSSPG